MYYFFNDIKEELVDTGIKRKILAHDGNLMVVKVFFEKGAIGQLHEHIHEQATYVINGEFAFTLGSECKKLKAGDSLYIPAGVIHGCECLSDGELLDIFTPQREDFIAH